jgi:hypothetical protein
LIPILCSLYDSQQDSLAEQNSRIDNLLTTTEELKNDTEKLNQSLISSLAKEKEEREKLEARINWNISQKADKEELTLFLENVTLEVESRKQSLIDIFDEKVRRLRDDFLTMEEYENHSSTLRSEIYHMVERQISVWDRYALYIFLSVCAVSITLIGIVKYKPQLIRKPIIKNYPIEKRSIEEITSKSDLKKQIELIRELKLRVIQDKDLKRKEKIELLKKIDRGKVWDVESLKKERELTVSMRGLDEGKKVS